MCRHASTGKDGRPKLCVRKPVAESEEIGADLSEIAEAARDLPLKEPVGHGMAACSSGCINEFGIARCGVDWRFGQG